MTVRWAYIGAGRHAELWVAPALETAANAAVVGVWSRSQETASGFAGRHAIGRVYHSVDEALADGEVDAVYVSTPNGLHAQHTLAAIRAGKHVLVEKPMATTSANALEMVRAAQSAGVRLGVGFHLRHHPLHEAARQHILAGDIGTPDYATLQFNLVSSPPPRMNLPFGAWKRDPEQMGAAGSLYAFGVHVLDLLRFVSGQEVVAVSALAVGRTPENPFETFGQIMLELDGGLQAHVQYGGRFPLNRNDVVVYGSAGRLTAENTVDVATQGILHVSLPDGRTGRRDTVWQPEPGDHYRRQIEAFGRAVEDGVPFGADGMDGVRSAEIVDAVTQSYDTGRRIEVRHQEVV